MVYGFVYCITNEVNGKQYVGITTKTILKRFREHCKADSYIGKAIRKHGIEKFSVSQIDSAATREELFLKEMHWVRELKTFGGGYNLTIGGEGGSTLPKLEINLDKNQERFIAFANKENKKPLDVNNADEMARSIIINAIYCYLLADYKHVKRQSAKMILRLKEEFREPLFKLNLFSAGELVEWAHK